MASSSSSTDWLYGFFFALLFLTLTVIPPTSGNMGISKEGCSRFCLKTGFSGVIGSCACGLSLFSAKRSVIPARTYSDWIVSRAREEMAAPTLQPWLPAVYRAPMTFGPTAMFRARLSRPVIFPEDRSNSYDEVS